MITVNGKIFLLSGKNFSYVFYVNSCGFLQNIHYGVKIGEADAEYAIERIGDTLVPCPEDPNGEMWTDGMPLETGTFGRGDYRDPTVIAERADGASMSRLRYVSHKIFKGVPEVPGMPHARSDGETLAVMLKDDLSSLFVVLNYTVWDDLNVLVRNAEYKNTGESPIRLKRSFSFCVDFPEREYNLLRLYGSWGKERYPEVTVLGRGITRIQSLRGISSHQLNPFAGLLCENCTENSGECYGAQLIYSGSFALTAEKTTIGNVRLQGGINDLNFAKKLLPEETFITPQVALAYSSDGTGGLSRAYADFLREQIIGAKRAYQSRPIVINSWEATYFNFDSEKLVDLIDRAAVLGIDTFVLDDGWFGKRNDDTSGLGDWKVNEEKLAGGLCAVIGRCKERGMKFGIWFEPEMISEDSDLYRSHPDWAIRKAGTEPVRGRNQLVLDFTRKEVVNYIFDAVSKILRDNDISYVKWDMNRSLCECYSEAMPSDEQGEFMHRYVLGVYDLAERLEAAFPDVFFEGCASGGGRFDAGMLYYFPQIWTSDDTDAYERTKIQWGTSMCYPVSAMSCHVAVCPSHQTRRNTPLATRGAVASLGAF
ncbi:MAG: alpha-galactosidase, partial [Candidatus Scatosoma sp.]